MSTLRQALMDGRILLESTGNETPDLDARLLLANVLGLNAAQVLARMNDALDSASETRFRGLLDLRASGHPVAYILGHKEFYGRSFKVDPRVLIPRPDTEILVEQCLEFLVTAWNSGRFSPESPEDPRVLKIIDCCTGSGCIAITLALELQAKSMPCQVLASDISPDALVCAGENVRNLGAGNLVSLVESDLLAEFAGQERSFHLICSNPPYLTKAEVDDGPARTWGEPLLALDGGSDGLDPYRDLVPQAKPLLVPGGGLFFELGSTQSREVLHILGLWGYSDTRCIQDLAGLDRVVGGRK